MDLRAAEPPQQAFVRALAEPWFWEGGSQILWGVEPFHLLISWRNPRSRFALSEVDLGVQSPREKHPLVLKVPP